MNVLVLTGAGISAESGIPTFRDADAGVFVAIGTSGLVYPAAGIVQQTNPGCRKIEINLGDTPASAAFDETIRGRASEELPRLLESMVA